MQQIQHLLEIRFLDQVRMEAFKFNYCTTKALPTTLQSDSSDF